MIPAALPIKCPACAVEIAWRHATFHAQFVCPACGLGLRFSGGYFRVLSLAAVVLVPMVAYAAGLRDDALFAAVVFDVWPAQLLLVLHFWQF